MQTVATFERVKAAFDQIVGTGDRPSAAKIVALIGGSKSTVLVHLRAIAEADGRVTVEPGQQLLESIVGNTTRRLWDEACKLARTDLDRRIGALTAARSDLFLDLQQAVAAEEEALDKLKQASDRIAELEAELALRDTAEEHLGRLQDLIVRLERTPGVPAREQFLLLLKDGAQHSKQTIYGLMASLGYDAAVVQKARFHAKQAGEVEELQSQGEADMKLRLTDKGRSRIKESGSTEQSRSAG